MTERLKDSKKAYDFPEIPHLNFLTIPSFSRVLLIKTTSATNNITSSSAVRYTLEVVHGEE